MSELGHNGHVYLYNADGLLDGIISQDVDAYLVGGVCVSSDGIVHVSRPYFLGSDIVGDVVEERRATVGMFVAE